MTQTPDNSRLDRIEAILERTVEHTSELRSAHRQEMSELRQTLTQLAAQTVADRETDRQAMNELREALAQLTRRVNNLGERMERDREQNAVNNSELVRGQAGMIEVIKILTVGQTQIVQTQEQMREMQASLAAAQERQERILDYLIRRSE